MTPLTSVKEAKEKLKLLISSVPQVNGIGITKRDGYFVIKVLLKEEVPAGTIQEQIDDVKIITEIVGNIKPLDEAP